MNRDQLDQVLGDFDDLRDPHADPELEAVKAAILLEDVFGIRLSDSDIDVALLPRGAMRKLVARSEGLT